MAEIQKKAVNSGAAMQMQKAVDMELVDFAKSLELKQRLILDSVAINERRIDCCRRHNMTDELKKLQKANDDVRRLLG